jgi:HK97 family phage prohead protease
MNKDKFPLSLIGNIEIVKKGENNRIIAGYASVAMVDSQNQFIPLETLKAGLNTLLGDMSYANLMLSHQNIQVGKILQKWGKLTTHVDDKGLYLLAKIREDIAVANEVWDSVLKGKINAFSIGCEVLSDPREVCDVNGCITYLDKINILECSLCSSPVNKLSGFTIISKSDSLSKDVCKSCNIMVEDKMTEEKVETPKVETKEEPKELSVEERIEAIERSIFNIQAAITKMSEPQVLDEEKAKKPVEEKPVVPPEEEKKPNEVPCKSEEVLTKKDFDEIKDMISKMNILLESMKPKEQDQKVKSELELALKARDEQIDSLKKHIETLSTKEQINIVSKAEINSEPKTVQGNVDKEKELFLEQDYPIVVSKGEVSFKKFV